MKDDVKLVKTATGGLRELLPPEALAEAIRDVFPRDVIVEAFREGLGLIFSPFTGFWRAVGAAMRRQPAR